MNAISSSDEVPVTDPVETHGASQSADTVIPDRIPHNAEYWLAINRLRGVGHVTSLKLLREYQSPQTAWQHSDADWCAAGAVRTSFSSMHDRSEALDWAKEQVDQLEKSSWMMAVIGDAIYPQSVAMMDVPPPFLFLLGTLPPPPAIGVVGARQVTGYGERVTRLIVSELAAAGVAIVSGFARGIDSVAHTAALDAGGLTVAVWGCGPDIIYPSEHKKLAERISAQGAIITEFPFGTPPEGRNFPIRNQLIAALSDGVLVTQARHRSGALLTAQNALDQGKTVYAIPAEIGRDQFVGTHELLKQGARIVTGADDILSDFQLGRVSTTTSAPVSKPIPSLTEIEHTVYDAVGSSPCPIDRLSVSLGLSAGECASILAMLEMKGIVIRSAGGHICRVDR